MKFTADISFKGSNGTTCHYEDEVCGKLTWVTKMSLKKRKKRPDGQPLETVHGCNFKINVPKQ